MATQKTNPARGEAAPLGNAGQAIANPKRWASLCAAQSRAIRRFGQREELEGALFTLQEVSRATGLSHQALITAIRTGKLAVVVRFKDLAAFGESRGAER
ncbi:MAG: hypothetical protein WBL99_05565 [Candidatus Acidiferrales bacterium]